MEEGTFELITQILRIIKKKNNYEQLHANKLGNLPEMGKFLET